MYIVEKNENSRENVSETWRYKDKEDRREDHYCVLGSLKHGNAVFMKGLMSTCSRLGRT